MHLSISGRTQEDLTVSDVLGMLEGEKQGMILTKSTDAWEEKFGLEKEETRREIDSLAPKAC